MKTKFSTRILALVLMLTLIVPMLVLTVSAEAKSATLTFDDKAKRTTFDTSKQVWTENGVTFTNNKAASTNAVADYAKPARLYAGSSIIVEAPVNITKIVFDCNNSTYATALKNSIGTTATVSVSSDKVTVTLDGSSTTFTVAKLTAQVRMDALTVDYATAEESDSTVAIREALNEIDLKMSMGYSYETSFEFVTVSGASTDTLNRALTGITNTTYASWSGKTAGDSGAVYAGNSAGGNSAIQLRSDNSNSGIVSTTSGGKIKSITITWNSNTNAARKLDVYGKNTPYQSATELYSSNTQGTKIATINCGDNSSITISGDYTYIGIRSNSGALYIDSIVIEWGSESGEDETVKQEVYSNSKFVLRLGAQKGLADIEGIDGYGLMVSAGNNTVHYTTDASSWGNDAEFCYVTLNLGDIINNNVQLSTKFTVKAYVQVGDNTFYSETGKTLSVADMIAIYQGLEIPEVAHLYSYLETKGLV